MTDYQLWRHYEHFSEMAVTKNFTVRGFYSNVQITFNVVYTRVR
jgi:hypothetical protein